MTTPDNLKTKTVMMMNFKLTLGAIAVSIVLCAGSVNAVEITSTISYGLPGVQLGSSHTTEGGTFDLNSPLFQFNTLQDTLNSAFVDFNFVNLDGVVSSVSLKIGNDPLTSSQRIRFAAASLSFDVLDLTGLAISGKLDYVVTWTSSTSTDLVNLQSVKLTADITKNAPVPNSVPDGGTTLSLLGLALTGLGLARRQLKA